MIECASLLLLVCRFVAGHPHLPGRPAGERLHLLTLSLFTNARQKSNVAETCPSCYEEPQTGRGDRP
jgi:hypothetical protein